MAGAGDSGDRREEAMTKPAEDGGNPRARTMAARGEQRSRGRG